MSPPEARSHESRARREQLFLEALPAIERVVGWVCARRGLRGAEAEDFASIVRLRLIENDYGILARFEGRSSLKTYVATVVNRLYLDHQRERFGKWRSSAEARRLGPTALRLEELLQRDGLSFDEACGVLGSDPAVTESREELLELCRRIPARARRRESPEGIPPEAAREDPATPVEDAEREALGRKVAEVLRRELARLAPRKRLLLRLHFEGGLSLADVARQLRQRQKPLYRLREALLLRLRRALEAEGLGAFEARTLLEKAWNDGIFGEEGQSEPGEKDPAAVPSKERSRTKRPEGKG